MSKKGTGLMWEAGLEMGKGPDLLCMWGQRGSQNGIFHPASHSSWPLGTSLLDRMSLVTQKGSREELVKSWTRVGTRRWGSSAVRTASLPKAPPCESVGQKKRSKFRPGA